MSYKKFLLIILILPSFNLLAQGQLSLKDVIRIASDSSLAAFKAQNVLASGYWEYKTYTALNKPRLTLNATPFDYNRAYTKRYNSSLDIDEYREQQNISSYANAVVSQNVPWTGGTLSFVTQLSRLQNFGENRYTQFSSIPFQVGYSQSIFGYNTFKWQNKISPLNYEKAKKTYLQTIENISFQMVDVYFDLLESRASLSMSKTNLANADTLYAIGQKRLEIATLSLADVLTLKVEALNARNKFAEADKQMKSAQFVFFSSLRKPEIPNLSLELPAIPTSSDADFEEAWEMLQKNNPDLLNNQLQVLTAESNMEKTKKENLLTASLVASYGLNQQGAYIKEAYRKPSDQQNFAVSFSLPIVDWGERKGKINMAKRNLEATKLSVEQANIDLKQSLMMAVTNFNMQKDIVKSASETKEVARQAYGITKQRFMIGKADVNTLSLALNRQDQANLDYINSLRAYWKYYYTLRQLTLYDFESKKELSQNLDEILNIR